ncbi:protein cornichon-like [Corticium candelabrum]|uniref:protein cornichon-like n=1 Tax=Corticium candelabrum TaxID=121492 RepID=UPI002E257EE5|nr:protein cornichon-like [Corticium candelabrum]
MVLWEAVVAIAVAVLDIGLIFFMVWNVICFDELRSDYRNPVDLCNSLNPLVLLEYFGHVLLVVLLAIGGFMWTLFLNVPLLLYHMCRYYRRPRMSVPGLYDPTNVMNMTEMKFNIREGWTKLVYYLFCFFFYLFNVLYIFLSETS